nr:gamma-glutamyl-gamma-aminobutyrate hydrolase family protein [Candidatus Woesearchaeota archaeon]
MLIAISQRNDKNKHGDLIDNLENNYVSYYEKFGIELFVVPNSSKNLDIYFKKLPIEGIILTGGNDVNPELYGEKIKNGMSITNERDNTERKLMDIAVKRKLPVLGNCRGSQFINVYFGGKLINIKEVIGDKVNHVASVHEVEIVDEKAKKLFGSKMEVNSYHNYGSDKKNLSPKLKIFARAKDGVIEGFYHSGLPIVGINWHPERKSLNEKENEKLIKAFLNRELFWK